MIVEQDVKNKRPIRHCEQSEAIQTWAAHPRLSLDCFGLVWIASLSLAMTTSSIRLW